MDFRQTLLLYLLIGAGVAIGFAARSSGKGRVGATIVAAWIFWPLFVPLLLSADEASVTPATPVSETLDARLQRGRDLLDRLAATGPALGIPDLPEQIAHIKAHWSERAAWLVETDRFIQTLKADLTTSTTMTASAPPIEELQRLQHSTAASLDRSLNGIEAMAVHLQLLRAPGVDRAVELERIERMLKTIMERDVFEAAGE